MEDKSKDNSVLQPYSKESVPQIKKTKQNNTHDNISTIVMMMMELESEQR